MLRHFLPVLTLAVLFGAAAPATADDFFASIVRDFKRNNMWPEPFVLAAREFLDAGVPVAAVCGATYGLAAAGLLDERRHTSNDPGFLASSGYAGADHYIDEPAVIDGDLVTATGVAPVHFARAVFERLDAHDPELIDSWFKLYADRDPAGFYELMAAETA